MAKKHTSNTPKKAVRRSVKKARKPATKKVEKRDRKGYVNPHAINRTIALRKEHYRHLVAKAKAEGSNVNRLVNDLVKADIAQGQLKTEITTA